MSSLKVVRSGAADLTEARFRIVLAMFQSANDLERRVKAYLERPDAGVR